MTIALVLILGALLVAWTVPRLVEYRLRAGADPQMLQLSWVALVGSTLLSLAVGAGLILLPGHGPARQVVALLHHCWVAVSHGSVPQIEEVAGLLALVLAALAAARGGIGLFRHARQRRQVHRKHLDLLRILANGTATRYPTLWLNVPNLMAYSVAGRPSLLVASEGLRGQLTEDAVAAVLEHERAHLRGRHHLMVALADALAAALPWLPLMRRSPYLLRALVEVSADLVAARSHGAQAVRSALLGMSTGLTPAHGLGMARDCIALRLTLLSTRRPERSRLRRGLRCGLAATLAAFLPILS
ncbi:MAG: M56 family metallopeptidase, partial [Actinobacteria bacterium]|nr:M56 family metallopeptidase [Actinomycetota bacterium]